MAAEPYELSDIDHTNLDSTMLRVNVTEIQGVSFEDPKLGPSSILISKYYTSFSVKST